MSRSVKFRVDKKIFEKSPGYRRVIVVAVDVDNTHKISALEAEINQLAVSIRNSVSLEDQRLVEWRDAFALFGIKVRDFRPSIDALVRRILNDKPLGSINPIVDVGTIISLKYLLPAGAHPLLGDSNDVVLMLAEGSEIEIASEGRSETIAIGEPVLLDNDRVATRRWVWRQTEVSRIDTSTTDFFLNIDALAGIEDATLQLAVKDAQKLIVDTFGASSQVIILNADSLETTVGLSS